MVDSLYTHTKWSVQPGRAEAFMAAWSELANAFLSLPEFPIWGTLLRSDEDPHLFYSFGPWRRVTDIEAMRAHPVVLVAYAHLQSLCLEMSPGAYQVVRHVASPSDEPATQKKEPS